MRKTSGKSVFWVVTDTDTDPRSKKRQFEVGSKSIATLFRQNLKVVCPVFLLILLVEVSVLFANQKKKTNIR